MRPVQYFSEEYLAQCKQATPEQIIEFLENYRQLQAPEAKSKLISLKVSEPLLASFRQKCEISNIKYQTKIKQLMLDWLNCKNN